MGLAPGVRGSACHAPGALNRIPADRGIDGWVHPTHVVTLGRTKVRHILPAGPLGRPNWDDLVPERAGYQERDGRSQASLVYE